jgi:heat shock protein HslJ
MSQMAVCRWALAWPSCADPRTSHDRRTTAHDDEAYSCALCRFARSRCDAGDDVLNPYNDVHAEGWFMVVRLLALIGVLASLGCGDSPLAPSDVIDHTWRLVSLQRTGSTPVVVDDSSRYTLQFADGRAAVKSDCNSCGGTYTLTDDTLVIGTMACTRAFCGETSLDPLFPQLLEGTHSAALEDDELTLSSSVVTLRLRR